MIWVKIGLFIATNKDTIIKIKTKEYFLSLIDPFLISSNENSIWQFLEVIQVLMQSFFLWAVKKFNKVKKIVGIDFTSLLGKGLLIETSSDIFTTATGLDLYDFRIDRNIQTPLRAVSIYYNDSQWLWSHKKPQEKHAWLKKKRLWFPIL